METEQQQVKKRWVPMPPTYFWSAVVLMVGLHFVCPIKQIITGIYRFLGAVLVVAGGWFNVWADLAFKKFKTTVKPFEQSNSLITSGLFRITRNPMYVGMVFTLLGLFVVLGSVTPIVIVPVFIIVVTVRFIIPEERDLERQFGEDFLGYKRKVRRWL